MDNIKKNFFFYTGWKAHAFGDVIKDFYGEHRSWKNVISIGDAPHEREAVFRCTKEA